MDMCFNCGELINDEKDVYAVLVGIGGRINFCEWCGKQFNIPNWYNQRPTSHVISESMEKNNEVRR